MIGLAFRQLDSTFQYLLCTFLLYLCAFVVPLHACSCVPQGTACESYNAADVVFVGSVPSGPGSFLRRLLWNEAVFQVAEIFKGDLGSEVAVYTRLELTGGCEDWFVAGVQYLVYASWHQGALHAGICTRTRELAGAEEDLSYLRRAKRGAIQGEIYGFVTREQGDYYSPIPTRPVAATAVTLSSLLPGRLEYSAVTDENGIYRFSGLQSGDYEIWIDPTLEAYPGSDYGDRRLKVKLSNGGCARIIWTTQATRNP